MAKIRAAVAQVPTRHRLLLGDARRAVLPAESVHLVLTSPPYWTLKEYRRAEGQLGWVADYDEFLDSARSGLARMLRGARARRKAHLRRR